MIRINQNKLGVLAMIVIQTALALTVVVVVVRQLAGGDDHVPNSLVAAWQVVLLCSCLFGMAGVGGLLVAKLAWASKVRRELAAGSPALDAAEAALATAQAELRRLEAKMAALQANHDAFVHAVSHDLQEPLRAVTSYTQLLKHHYAQKLPEQADEFLGFIEVGAKRLHQLLNALRDLARIESRGKPAQSTGVATAVASARAMLASAFQANNAAVQCCQLPAVMVDPAQLTQLFIQLFDNCLKFRATAPLVISVHASRQQEMWQLAVRDNGQGFEPDQAKRVFKVFCRGHAQAKLAGVGMGLTLCERIVQRHGGRIWVETEPDVGTTVYFTLPPVAEALLPPAVAVPAAPEQSLQDPTGLAQAWRQPEVCRRLANGNGGCPALASMQLEMC